MATNRKPQIEGVAGALLGLTWISAILRFYVKGFMRKTFGLEDLLILVALLLFTLTAAFALLGISHSMGLHYTEVPLQDLSPAMMYWFSVELAYVMTTCFLKLSIAVFLLRIATKTTHRVILYGTMCLVTVLTMAYFLFLVFQCKPVDYFWNQFTATSGSCLPPKLVGDMTYVHSAINASADVVLALLPVVMVSQLQMNPRTKITVCGILGLGLVACAAVIVRIPYVKILVDNAKDFLFSSTDVVLWSAIEPGLGITAANMATLRPLFSHFLSRSKLFGSTTAKAKSIGQYGNSYAHSRNKSGFGSARRGYMRSGSQGGSEIGRAVEMQEFAKEVSGNGSGVITIVEAGSEERLNETSVRWQYQPQEQRIMGDGQVTPWPQAITKTVRTEVVSGATDLKGESFDQIRTGGYSQRRRSSVHSLEGGLSPPHWRSK